jgi:putative Mg2+ transporter-C (MgtC) family protein
MHLILDSTGVSMTFLNELFRGDTVFIARLFIALLLGGLVGLERQTRGRPAGLRTNILVCLGSAALMVAFQKLYFNADPGVESAIRMDPARAAAGIITGIGFLGAGTIVKSENFVRGLTTAASIWVVSAVGITVGLGEYLIAIVLTFLVLVTLFALDRIPIGSDRYARLHFSWRGDFNVIDDVVEIMATENIKIKHRTVTCRPATSEHAVDFSLRFRDNAADSRAFKRLQGDSRFDEVTWE